MTNAVAIVRGEVEVFGQPRIKEALLVWCPGCGTLHRMVFWKADGQDGPVWSWDKNLEASTLEPSILVTWTHGETKLKEKCHSYLRNGRWQFLSDCTHSLAGQTVDMVPLPDWVVTER